MTTKDFTGYAQQIREERGEPVTFTLDGETYRAISPLPAVAVLDLMAADNDADALRGFFTAALAEGEWERLRVASASPIAPISREILAEVMHWLMEESTGRPTKAPASSQAGRSSSGKSSTNASPPTE